MLKLIKNAAKFLLRTKPASRGLAVYSDDIFLVSYPKSGNTWIRFLVGNLISDKTVNFSNIESIIPDIYQHNQSFFTKVSRPRIIKSHEYFCPLYKKVIYVVRDPRDVAVSYYFHQKKFRRIDNSVSISEFTNKFLEGNIDPFGSWAENVGSWIGAREFDKNFLLVRYEDLIADTVNEISRISDFMNLQNNCKSIIDAIEASTLDKMKSIEKTTGNKSKALRKSDKNMPFVRKGKCYDWKNHLSSRDAFKIEKEWHYIMAKLNYIGS